MISPTKEQIKSARAQSGLTQTKAAEVVHVSLRCWQKWEGGERAMPPATWELFLIKTGQWSVENERTSDGK